MRPANQALIVIDVQNDFCPGGALAVEQGDQIIEAINDLAGKFHAVVFTQDWHPGDHSSFATTHERKAPFENVDMAYGPQTLWPVHCVQGTPGAAFHARLRSDRADLILRKGFRTEVDSYSAFFENDHSTATGLHGYLQTRGIDSLTLVGLATDFCVNYSALDAAKLGYAVTVLESACRAIDLDGSLKTARQAMRAAGVVLER
ncbi:MAG: bifunctional nicotinamidase/pyrazinamidase [Paracoccaceae bacterium]